MPETTPTPLRLRELEVAQYEANIAMYRDMAANLPSVYPAHLLQYKNAVDKHAVIATIENLDDVELLSDLWAYDAAQAAIRTETVEKRKAEAILAVLRNQA